MLANTDKWSWRKEATLLYPLREVFSSRLIYPLHQSYVWVILNGWGPSSAHSVSILPRLAKPSYTNPLSHSPNARRQRSLTQSPSWLSLDFRFLTDCDAFSCAWNLLILPLSLSRAKIRVSVEHYVYRSIQKGGQTRTELKYFSLSYSNKSNSPGHSFVVHSRKLFLSISLCKPLHKLLPAFRWLNGE